MKLLILGFAKPFFKTIVFIFLHNIHLKFDLFIFVDHFLKEGKRENTNDNAI
jgi:hypothetical protein